MRQVSQQALQALLAQSTDEIFIPCLHIDHPTFAAPIRIAYNSETVTRADGDYLPYPFQITLPSQREDEVPSVKITVDNTDLSINDAIRNLVGAPSVRFDVVLASAPDSVEAGPFYFELQQATADANTIQGTLGQDASIFSQLFPGQQYDPTSSPGLFT